MGDRKRTTRRTLARGMTLLELLLALAGTAAVGTAVAAMLTGVAYGTQSDKDLRGLITRQMALRSRVEAEVRESRMILDAGGDYLILWSGDTDGSGTPDKREIQVIEYDAESQRVMRYAPAAGIADEAYALSDDLRTATNAYKGEASFPGEPWADSITSLAITLDDIDPQSARLVAMRFGMQGGEVPDTAISAAALRGTMDWGVRAANQDAGDDGDQDYGQGRRDDPDDDRSRVNHDDDRDRGDDDDHDRGRDDDDAHGHDRGRGHAPHKGKGRGHDHHDH